MTDDYLIKRFGMTAEAMRRVMKNHKSIVNAEVHKTIWNADYYMNPTDYIDADDLPDGWDEKDEDDDGYSNLYNYAEDLFGEDGTKVFKSLISWGTKYGGMGSAVEALVMLDGKEKENGEEE